MKNTVLLVALGIIVGTLGCSNSEENSELKISDQIMEEVQKKDIDKKGLSYDEEKARRLGADEYGMKKYVMALLKNGPNRDLPEAERLDLQNQHLKNIEKMAEEGVLIVAGPFVDEGDLKGIYVLDVQTIEEAMVLTESDPAIQAGSLVMELHPWYSSAALVEINNIHKTLAKTNPWDN